MNRTERQCLSIVLMLIFLAAALSMMGCSTTQTTNADGTVTEVKELTPAAVAGIRMAAAVAGRVVSVEVPGANEYGSSACLLLGQETDPVKLAAGFKEILGNFYQSASSAGLGDVQDTLGVLTQTARLDQVIAGSVPSKVAAQIISAVIQGFCAGMKAQVGASNPLPFRSGCLPPPIRG